MIKVAIIGTGGISGTHINAYHAFPDRCRVTAFVDPSLDVGKEKRREFGPRDARVYRTHEELLAHEDVDLVSVCSPPDTHERISVDCLSTGVNVLCEKPMAPSVAACDAILRAEAASGAVFGSIAQNRFRDDVARLKAAVDSGLLGQITHVQVDSAWWRGLPYYDMWWRGTWAREGGGPTLNHAVHHIDLLLWLLGAPTAVTAVLTNAAHENAEVEDLSVAVLRYERALATVTSSVVDHGERQRILVHGRAASVSLEGDVIAEISQPNGFPDPAGNTELMDRLRTLMSDRAPLPHTGHLGQIDDMLSAIEEGRRPTVDGRDGRLTIEVITTIYQAGIEHRTVDLPLPVGDPYYQSGAVAKRAPRFFAKSASVRRQSGSITVSGEQAADAAAGTR